jgi:hypothetical protein
MKKLILILLLAILFATQPLIASASLYSYYKELGQSLPSIAERAVLYSEIGDDKYVGSASQNNALEASLRGQLGAITPQPRLLGDNTWTGTNTFNGTTTVPSVTTYGTSTTSTNVANQAFVSDFSGYNFSSSSAPTRAINTTYQNNTGKTLFVVIQTLNDPPSNVDAYAYALFNIGNGVSTTTVSMVGNTAAEVPGSIPAYWKSRTTVSFFVAPGQYYIVSYLQNISGSVVIEHWTEYTNR